MILSGRKTTAHTADAVIIGGGITGCGVAYRLAQAGLSVVVLEQGALNQGASGRNAGGLYFQLQHQAAQFNAQQRSMLATMLPMVKASQQAWYRLASELGPEVGLVQTGGLMVAQTDEEVVQLKTKYALEQAWQIETRLIDKQEIKAIAPSLSNQLQAAIYCPWDGQANPRTVTIALAEAALRYGAVFYQQTEVVALQHQGTDYTVSTRCGRKFSTPLILNAAGAWTNKMAAMLELPNFVQPKPLQICVTEKTSPLLPVFVQYIGHQLSVKQGKTGNLLIGGGWPALLPVVDGKPQKNTPIPPLYESLARNVALAVQVVPALQQVRLLRIWTGLAAWTPDGLPILGEVSGHPKFYMACGGNGFSLGPLFAELVAAQMLQQPAPLNLTPFSPARFLN